MLIYTKLELVILFLQNKKVKNYFCFHLEIELFSE